VFYKEKPILHINISPNKKKSSLYPDLPVATVMENGHFRLLHTEGQVEKRDHRMSDGKHQPWESQRGALALEKTYPKQAVSRVTPRVLCSLVLLHWNRQVQMAEVVQPQD
jgi:hypothetical protein